MKKINVRFEKGGDPDAIEVVIRAPEQDEDVRALMEQLSDRKRDMLSVTATDGRMLVLLMDEIISVSVVDKLSLIVTADDRYIVRQPLASIESQLDAWTFLRISRHEIINTDKIRKYDFTVSGMPRLELAGGIETWVSRRCIPALRKRLKGKAGSV